MRTLTNEQFTKKKKFTQNFGFGDNNKWISDTNDRKI